MDYEPVRYSKRDRRLGRLPSGADVTVTVHRYVGGVGPTVYVQAAQHGIELNGPAALRRLHHRLVDATVAGTVVVVPLVNAPAFDHRSYVTPPEYDAKNPNMNRVWPGDEEGSLQERMAARLWELVGDADAVVDLHTGTADMLEHVRFAVDDDDARALAKAFGYEYLLADPDEAPADEPFSGKFRRAATRAGIPALTAELGNSRTVTDQPVEAGVDGVWNVLRDLEVLEGTPDRPPTQSVLRDDAAQTDATASGLFEPEPTLDVGDAVESGDPLGTVYCPSSFERRQRVTAVDPGVLYSLKRGGVVVTGERLASVASPV